MPDDRIPIVAPPAYVVLVQAALGERYRVTASTVALAGYSDPHKARNNTSRTSDLTLQEPGGIKWQQAESFVSSELRHVALIWSCGHYHPTRQEAAECVRRQAGALC